MTKEQKDICMEALNEIADYCHTTIFTDQMSADDCIDLAQDRLAKIADEMDKVRDIIMGLE